MTSVASQTDVNNQYQLYYDPETTRWIGVEINTFPKPIPCPGAPKQGFSQHFDRDTWSWIFTKR